MPFQNALHDMTDLGQGSSLPCILFGSIAEYHRDHKREALPVTHSRVMSFLSAVIPGFVAAFPPSMHEHYSGHAIFLINSRCSFQRMPGSITGRNIDGSVAETFDMAGASLDDKSGLLFTFTKGKYGLSEHQQERIGDGAMQIYPVLVCNVQSGMTWLRDYQTVPFFKDHEPLQRFRKGYGF